MTRRRLTAAVIALVAVAAAVVVAVVLMRGDADAPRARPTATPTPTATATPTATPTPSAAPGQPSRLRIPAIDVDAPVVPVGTTKDNAQEVPSSMELAGWWRDGVVPGRPGNAVVVGHTASADDGVFDDLVDVAAGDRVVVTTGKADVAFRVTGTRTVPVPDFADVAGEVYRDSGAPGLVLMTCGDWNGQEFETTVIVTAEAVDAPRETASPGRGWRDRAGD